MAEAVRVVGGIFILCLLALMVITVGAVLSGTGEPFRLERTYTTVEQYIPYAPMPDEVKLRAHAVESHGDDALRARERLQLCDTIEAYYCMATTTHPRPRYVLICRNLEGWCAGMIVNDQGVEVTSWCAPCVRWDSVVGACLITQAKEN